MKKNMAMALEKGIIPNVIVRNKKITDEVQFDYEESDIDEEMLEKAKEGFFVRNAEQNYVYCPEGNILRETGMNRCGSIRYSNRHICRKCKNKCTKAGYKEVYFGKDQLVHGLDRNRKSQEEKNVKRHKITKKIIIYTFHHNTEKLKRRMSTSEHPFGTVKRNLSGYYCLLKGKTKVEAEMALLFLSYNLRRAINMKSVSELVKKLGN